MFNPFRHKIILLLPFLFCSTLFFGAAAQDTTTLVYDTAVGHEGVSAPAEDDDEEEAGRPILFDSIQGPVSLHELTIPDSAISKLKNDDAFWYVNEKPVKQQPKPRFWQMDWFKSLMWFLMIGAFIAILVWFLASSNIFLFRRKEQSLVDEGEQPTDKENIFEINFPQEIGRALASQNYNLAIRLYYLQVLKRLSNKNLIQYAQDKTNSEYVSQLYSSSYYKDFFRLTRQFEYAWYGQFPVSEPMFRAVEEDFKQFTNRI